MMKYTLIQALAMLAENHDRVMWHETWSSSNGLKLLSNGYLIGLDGKAHGIPSEALLDRVWFVALKPPAPECHWCNDYGMVVVGDRELKVRSMRFITGEQVGSGTGYRVCDCQRKEK